MWPYVSDPRRPSSGVRRGLALALAVVLAISGFLHGLGGDLGESHGHGPMVVSQGALDAPCGPEQDSHQTTDGTTCGTATNCPLCAPVEASAAPAVWTSAPADLRPATVPLGRVLAPHFRPPQGLPNA